MLSAFTNYTLLAFFVTAAWAPLLIDFLYKFNIVIQHKLMRNKMNAEFIKIHGHKSGTPRSGGLMISVTVAVLTLLFVPTSSLRNVFLLCWVLFAAYGLADDLLVSGRKVSDKFRLFQESFGWRVGKLLALYLIALLAVILVRDYIGISHLTIWDNLQLEISNIVAIVLAFFVVLAMYAVEVTDGADALVTGQFLIHLAAYSLVAVLTLNPQLLPYGGLIMGSAFVYLYFNINPARVFMGGSGTLPVAFFLILSAAVTDTLPVLLVMGVVYWVELASSTIQILSIKFRHKKVFRIAPLHHHFEAIGWPEPKVVQRFWLACAVSTIIGLWVLSLM